MAKVRSHYTCQACGAQFPKWLGRCTECQAWNSLIEEVPVARSGYGRGGATAAGPPQARPLAQVAGDEPGARLTTGLAEVDRVLGGGLLAGSTILLGGDPGIGKSTLVLQVLDRLGQAGQASLYITGEESAAQIKHRAERLGLAAPAVHLLAEVELERMLPEIERLLPKLVVVDSIQTVRSAEFEAIAGNVTQVRACAARLIQLAKTRGAALLLIGHVTKEGLVAGPRTLEHMVDVVLYLEGEPDRPQRVLRSVKNRFGALNEIGLFKMTGAGLEAVTNPSGLFLQERSTEAAGTVVFAGMEGTRPLLIEIQALVGESAAAYPRRTALGLDPNRVALLQAVIEKHLGDALSGLDIYLNVVGGLRLSEPALDAAVLAAVLSSFRGRPLDPATVVFGEVGLTGELRAVGFAVERIAEAARLGFRRALLPASQAERSGLPQGFDAVPAADVRALARALLG
ncbi:MAG: DNA repair protein RadA [Candidatus Lambdaproteobacteria bacterium]|nr:DNA repair protein RadA [Candidatus Lambdaproteobacteria bacterium]